MKPRIALLVRMDLASSHHYRYSINTDYVDSLRNAGADVHVILPQERESLVQVLKTMDGLVVPGGVDVDPFRYQQPNIDSTVGPYEIDDLDIDSIQIAHELNLPILGICRGLQVINVALGGSLIQDIQSSLDHRCSTLDSPLVGHTIFINLDSHLYSLLGAEMEVNSFHHQAIDQLANGLSAVAYSYDGIIEAIESDTICAVQWHPERMTELPQIQAFFEDFVERCQR